MTPAAWRLTSGVRPLLHSWGDETAIFFAGPGDTQLVNRVGATVAAELAGGPRSVDDLAEAVIAQSGWDDLLTLKLALTSLLGQWQKAGLVEPDDR